jgi:hypothetical protein
MQSDGCTWHQTALEYTVSPIKEHLGGKFFLTTLEIWQMRKFYLFKLDDHIFYIYSV